MLQCLAYKSFGETARRRNYVWCKQNRMKQRRDVCGGRHRRFCVKGAPVVMRVPSGAAATIHLLHKYPCWTVDRYLLHFSIIPSHCVFFFLSVCLSGEPRGSSRQHALIRMVRFCSGLRSSGEPSVPLLDLRLSGSANLSSPRHLPLLSLHPLLSRASDLRCQFRRRAKSDQRKRTRWSLICLNEKRTLSSFITVKHVKRDTASNLRIHPQPQWWLQGKPQQAVPGDDNIKA